MSKIYLNLKVSFIFSLLSLIALLNGCKEKSSDTSKMISENDRKQISNYLGHAAVNKFKAKHFPVDLDSYIEGVNRAKRGEPNTISQQEFNSLLKDFQNRSIDIISSENLKAANAFLEKNRTNSDVVVLEDGKLQYKILTQGAQDSTPVEESGTPLVIMEGKYADGKVFDDPKTRSGPISIALETMPSGFAKGVVGMRKGEKRRIFIHPKMGFGKVSTLLPNALIIYDVEVIEPDVRKKVQNQNAAPE